MRRLRPFFSYYGGKHRQVRRYPRPRHRRIVECFAGSAGYATAYYEHDVLLVDTDEIVCGTWDFLISATAAEIAALPLMPLDGTIHDLKVPQEAKWLIGYWLSKGQPAPAIRPSPWMRSGKWPSSFWGEEVRAKLALQVDLIRHWRVLHGSYKQLELGAGDTCWFVDPPYVGKGKHYRKGSGGIDYKHLGTWVQELPGQVIACEQAGADWLPFEPFHSLKTMNQRGFNGYSEEVIWTAGCEAEQGVLL